MTIPNLNNSNPHKISDLDDQINQPFRKGSWTTSTNLFLSFKYALQGLHYTFKSQRNFRIHTLIGLGVIFLSTLLKLSTINIAILVITIAAVLVLELINTSIESVVDLTIGQSFHPLARIAKDCAAASVLVASISSFIIAILILIPPILRLFF